MPFESLRITKGPKKTDAPLPSGRVLLKSGRGTGKNRNTIAMSLDVIQQVGFQDGDRIAICLGTGEDEGWLQLRQAERKEYGRVLIVQTSQAILPITAERLGFTLPEGPSKAEVEYRIEGNSVLINVSDIGQPQAETGPGPFESLRSKRAKAAA